MKFFHITFLIILSFQALAVDGERKLSRYELSPLSQYLTEQQYQEVFESPVLQERPASSQGLYANALTVDTRDSSACEEVKNSLEQNFPSNDYSDLCIPDPDNPYNTVIAVKDNTIEYKTYISEINKTLPPEYKALAKESRNLVGLGILTIGVLYMLPEDVTNWKKDEIGLLNNKWQENVKAGPVVDKDDWAINYIGHPLAGAAYHMVARGAGLGPWQSFGYSVVMSTFFWEYGLEAFAEVPSIQDLIITPVIGSLLGEMFYSATQKINRNGGRLFGSKRAGTIAKNVMNPSEPIRHWINDNIFEREFLKKSRSFIYLRGPGPNSSHLSNNGNGPFTEQSVIGFGLEFKFNL